MTYVYDVMNIPKPFRISLIYTFIYPTSIYWALITHMLGPWLNEDPWWEWQADGLKRKHRSPSFSFVVERGLVCSASIPSWSRYPVLQKQKTKQNPSSGDHTQVKVTRWLAWTERVKAMYLWRLVIPGLGFFTWKMEIACRWNKIFHIKCWPDISSIQWADCESGSCSQYGMSGN